MRRTFIWLTLLGALGCGEDKLAADSAASAAAQVCVDTINQYRATLGLAPLARWSDAEACASGQARSDSESGTAHGAFGRCGEHAQNECPGWSGTYEEVVRGCLAMMWNEGPGGGHYENMKSGGGRVACGFYRTPENNVWAVQDYP
jgi:hypothetical protein